MSWPACGGKGALLGAPGCLTWLQCRACGVDYDTSSEES
jgi:hypothetical protein